MSELATFGGGCFWCLDAIFRRTKGISKVSSGYSGGHVENPTYEKLHTEDTGHAEAVQVEFDPSVIPYEVLLQIFWTSHNPTTPNQDGANIGPEYRSIIFYHNQAQKAEIERVKHDFAEKLWSGPIVTEIVPYAAFYDAEDYHQDYYTKQTSAPYCQIIINPKLQKFREKFKDYVLE